jgi:hypothetical protein
MSRGEKVAMVVTPLVAMATLALGLHVGGPSAMHAAIVYAAPPAAGASVSAWQIVSVLEDRGVRESVPVSGLTVKARSAGHEATWRGSTNGDGIAEIQLEMPWLTPGDPLEVTITSPTDDAPLARGRVAWSTTPWTTEPGSPFVRPSKREGDVALDLAVHGARLTPGFPTSVWVRATDPATSRPLAGVVIEAEPEPGLTLGGTQATTCALGWAELRAQPIVHVIGLSLHARAADGKTGDWYGAPTVAPGSSHVSLPSWVEAGAPRAIEVVAPTARQVAYVEVDDAQGRAFATALPLVAEAGGVPRARFEMPPLAPGLHWLVTSGEPRGAESLTGAAVARPFWVEPPKGGGPGSLVADPCALGAKLAMSPAGGFHRWLALDGFAGREDSNVKRRRLGMILALGSLAIAAVLEVLLLMRGAQRTRADLERAARSLEDAGAGATLTRKTSAGSVAIGVLIALLGFGLLASMLMWKAG